MKNLMAACWLPLAKKPMATGRHPIFDDTQILVLILILIMYGLGAYDCAFIIIPVSVIHRCNGLSPMHQTALADGGPRHWWPL